MNKKKKEKKKEETPIAIPSWRKRQGLEKKKKVEDTEENSKQRSKDTDAHVSVSADGCRKKKKTPKTDFWKGKNKEHTCSELKII